ncbi:MAG: WecB/TagA/CpsF family glycosyltransferase [Massilia sp.]
MIINSIGLGQGGWIITCNTDIMRKHMLDPTFRRLAAEASLIVADGMPLIWASRVQGAPLPERVAGSNLISSLSAAAARAGRSVFLLGGDPGTAEEAADALRRVSPELLVAGTLCPPPGFESDASRMDEIRVALERTQPAIVYVALGSPKQEVLIAQLRDAFPASWWIGVGISFSFLAGRVRRAPRWIQRCGLEWAHRLCQEPGRLARRYLLHGIPFTMFLLMNSMIARVRKETLLLKTRVPRQP